MDSNKPQGYCCICGELKELTFEHVPPSCSFNNKPIFIQGIEHLWDDSSYVFGKKRMSNRGLGSYSLCAECNNKTGAWYAKDFCEFAKQGMNILRSTQQDSRVIDGTYFLKPLNVFKQIVAMFMSADKSGHLRDNHHLRAFLLDKELQKFPEEFRVYLYSNASPFKRLAGYTLMYVPTVGVVKWSEINFQPFGYFLTENSSPPNQYMIDITSWSEKPYDSRHKISMRTYYLGVNNLNFILFRMT